MDRQSPEDFLARHGEFVEPAKLEALTREAEKFAREKANGGSPPTGSQPDAERDVTPATEPMPAARVLPRVPRFVPAYRRGIKVLDGEELLTTQFPPRTTIMSPWLPDKGLAMLYAERGVGKTWIALGAAHAVASGGEFLCWRAERPAGFCTSTAKCPPTLFKSATRRSSGRP
jgi:hypothetical protein